jgi:hypothetical protein
VAIIKEVIMVKLKKRKKIVVEETANVEERKSKPKERERVNIGVAIKTDLWRQLKALAITQGRLTGELLDEAIEKYLKSI